MRLTRTGTRPPARFVVLVLSLFVLVMSGCSVKLISDYDEFTDKAVVALHRKVDAFLRKMEDNAGFPAGTYAKNKEFYQEVMVDLSSMRMRASAIPQNQLTLEHIDLLEQNIEKLRELHEKRGEKGLAKALVDPIQTALDAQFTAIMKLELAKKRGDST